jgi:hypothetical protein
MKKLAKMMAVAIASVVLSAGSLSAVEIKKYIFLSPVVQEEDGTEPHAEPEKH